jgi:drug/metabolite transporter (DMT)-like permease
MSNDNTKGAGVMMASMALFTFNDACMKALGVDLPLFQTIFLRGIITSILLGLWAWHLGAHRIVLGGLDKWRIVVRSVAEAAAAYFFLTAIFNAPIADATAVLQALPLTVTLAAAVFLKESVGWRRLSAIVIGFVGVLLIIQPGGQGFNIYTLYALIAVGCVAVRELVTRQMSAHVPTMGVAFAGAVTVMALAGLGATGQAWAALQPLHYLLLVGAALFVLGGYVLVIMASRLGDVGFIAPFRYTSMIWALLLGYFVWGEWPNNLTLIGALLVTVTGIFTLYRERQLRKRQRSG